MIEFTDDDFVSSRSDSRSQDLLSGKQLTGENEEQSLRPTDLDSFIGQNRVREQLGLLLTSASSREVVPDHILFSGPPGLGKTSMAMIIAKEMGTVLRTTSGPALERPGDLASILSNLQQGDVLFIDEIHRIHDPQKNSLPGDGRLPY